MELTFRRAIGLVPLVLVIGAVSVTAFGHAAAAPQVGLGFAEIRDGNGVLVGAATLQRVADGIQIRARFRGLPPGEHGYHVHGVAKCEGPGFVMAEEPFNPTHKEHGLLNPLGHQVGDLPNLVVGDDGTASIAVVAQYATLAPGDMSLLDADGSSLVVHANRDDQVSAPDGKAGPGIACGVIGLGLAHSVDGHLFVNEPEETKAAFEAAWGRFAPEEWVLERNAQLAQESQG